MIRYTYIVETVSRATVTKRWNVTSQRPLARADIKARLEDGDGDAEVACFEEVTSDEQDREVVCIDSENVRDAVPAAERFAKNE